VGPKEAACTWAGVMGVQVRDHHTVHAMRCVPRAETPAAQAGSLGAPQVWVTDAEDGSLSVQS